MNYYFDENSLITEVGFCGMALVDTRLFSM